MSTIKKGMYVRGGKSLIGAWKGFIGVEFYVLEDHGLPGFGIRMAIRHVFDVDPVSSILLNRGEDLCRQLLFHYIALPPGCVEPLTDQAGWSCKNDNAFKQVLMWVRSLGTEYYEPTIPVFRPELLERWVDRDSR